MKASSDRFLWRDKEAFTVPLQLSLMPGSSSLLNHAVLCTHLPPHHPQHSLPTCYSFLFTLNYQDQWSIGHQSTIQMDVLWQGWTHLSTFLWDPRFYRFWDMHSEHWSIFSGLRAPSASPAYAASPHPWAGYRGCQSSTCWRLPVSSSPLCVYLCWRPRHHLLLRKEER